jgi:hypothetical protein
LNAFSSFGTTLRTTFGNILGTTLGTALGLSVFVATAPYASSPAVDGPILVQGADCYAIGEQEAATQGGTLASASDAVKNGQPVCRVILVIPGQNGERPKRVEIIVPKG